MNSSKKKQPIAKILIVTVFLIGLVSVFFPSERKSMERVLREDSATGVDVSSVAEVVRNMRAISLKGCPQDFQAAYVRHINAWEDLAELELSFRSLQAYGNSWDMVIDSFIEGYMGNPFGVVGEISQQQVALQARYYEIQQDIKRTYRDVESIAVSAGCALPSY